MHVTIIHPAVGKIPGKEYLRAWQMEPLMVARLAALMPRDLQLSFWDDRMEEIPYANTTDLVVMSVETYTAKRAYQISSEYRARGIPVIMGGFHATLCPDEVTEYAEAIVLGEAEVIWQLVIQDFFKGKLKRIYCGGICDFSNDILPDRSIYAGKKYVPISLVEFGRGCRFHCEFCSIHNFFRSKHAYRDIPKVIEEIEALKKKTKLFFFTDDNIVSNHSKAKVFFKELVKTKIKWVGQADISIAKDSDLIHLMVKSGCQGVLIGLESISASNLVQMKKAMCTSKYEIEQSVKRIHALGLRIYATFLFGYDHDQEADFDEVLSFCVRNKVFMVGFNHLTPFPGTQLYNRLQKKGLLFYEKWWLSDEYSYGQLPFKTELNSSFIENECRRIRRKFYSFFSILYRMTNLINVNSFFMFSFYLYINLLLKRDTNKRKNFPLGDLNYNRELIKVKDNCNVSI